MLSPNLELAIDLIKGGRHVVAFTGAGISVESGIPPFRGKEGLWEKYDPDILDINRYRQSPEESWPVIYELFYQFFQTAEPNPAHFFLASLEAKGILKALITQNIDNLHQEAGSKDVIEYHGNSHHLICEKCHRRYSIAEVPISIHLPRCPDDEAVLKPDFVFFGEPIPEKAASRAASEAVNSDVLIIIGTTGEIMPASMLPQMAKNSGSKIIEINTERSNYTESLTNVFLKGKAGTICSELMNLL